MLRELQPTLRVEEIEITRIQGAEEPPRRHKAA
jgi:hypothetical protein